MDHRARYRPSYDEIMIISEGPSYSIYFLYTRGTVYGQLKFVLYARCKPEVSKWGPEKKLDWHKAGEVPGRCRGLSGGP